MPHEFMENDPGFMPREIPSAQSNKPVHETGDDRATLRLAEIAPSNQLLAAALYAGASH